MYLAINKAITRISTARREWSNNIKDLESLLKLLSGKVNLDQIELNRPVKIQL